MPLWMRIRDGDHNGRPIYEYACAVDSIAFKIVWSTDRGFGLSAFDHKAQKYLADRRGISWLRSLKNCKAEAERLLAKHRESSYGK